jgi:hypothetical protein
MPRALDNKLIAAIEKAYLDREARPSLKELADEFGIGLSTLKGISSKEGWAARRDAAEAAKIEGRVEGAKAVLRPRGVDGLTAIRNAITDISAEVSTIEAKSKEGCATALVNLLKAERELFPPNAEELAELAVRLDISPADFLRALKAKWADAEQQQKSA